MLRPAQILCTTHSLCRWRQKRAFRPSLEGLEQRLAPSAFVVTATADSGAGSLRQAITDANANPGADTITFSITGTIDLLTALPAIDDSVHIAGPGAALLTVERSSGAPAFSILRFRAGTTDTVSGLTIARGAGTRSGITPGGTGPETSGGGINNAGTLMVQACALTGNVIGNGSPALGGGIASTGPLTVLDCTFSQNQVLGLGSSRAEGGGIYATADLTITNSLFQDEFAFGNTGLPGPSPGADGLGGGIFIGDGAAVVAGSAFVGDRAIGGQGGAGPTGAGPGGNGLGGGLFLGGGSLQMVNDTVTQGIAQGGNGGTGGHGATITTAAGNGEGGGIDVGGGTLTMTNCKVTSNSVLGGTSADPALNGRGAGGGLLADSGPVRLTNTIMAGNGANTSGPDGQGTVGGDFNLIQNPSGVTFSGNPGHTITGQGPRLGPLQNNGGPTPSLALLAGSPAIDAGTSAAAPTVDQRGQPRGIPDLGAYEAHPWIQAIPDQITAADTPLTVPFQTGDAALFATEPIAAITLVSDNQKLVPNANLQAGGSDTNRALTITPAAGELGAVYITVTVRAGNESMSDTFQLTIGSSQTIAGVSDGNSSIVFVVNAQHALFRYDGRSGWVQIGGAGTVASVCAVLQPLPIPGGTRDAVAFVVTTDHSLAGYDDLHGWQQRGDPGTIRSASAGNDRNGLADVFVLTTAGALTEWSTSSGWLPAPIGGPGSILGFSAFTADRVDVVTNDHSIFRFDPQLGWLRLTGADFARAVSTSRDGTTFAQTLGNAPFRHDAAGWIALGAPGTIGALDAGLDASDHPEIFALTTDGAFAEYNTPNGWQVIGAPNTVRSMSAGDHGHVFVLTTGGSVAGHGDQTGWFTLAGLGLAGGATQALGIN